jgi:nicotinate phosphoribosyltransferase
MSGPATFSLFVRRLPPGRGYLIAAGLADVLEYLESFRFSPRGLAYLGSLQRFDPGFLQYLATVRFTGSVRAMREGTPVFPDEPLLEVTAPIAEAQLVESVVLNLCHFQTMLVSKAVRCVRAAGGRSVVEFGLRRTQGLDAALKAARAAYLAGAETTSNVLAGLTYGIPPVGTMAHSYVTAFPSEMASFRAFARAFPRHTTLLLDTYDTLSAAHKAVEVAREMEARGERLGGVRLDSGDLVKLSRAVRDVFDRAGLPYVRILASGGLDESEIAACVSAGAPIDAFGVGTKMDVSADAPYLDMAYKLVRYDGRDVLKTSEGKQTWAGEKQVYRVRGPDGRARQDTLARHDQAPLAGEPLLRPVMIAGRRSAPHPTLAEIRDYCRACLDELPVNVLRLAAPEEYPVLYSRLLIESQHTLTRATLNQETSRQGR